LFSTSFLRACNSSGVPPRSHYDALDLTQRATSEQIKTAYYDLSKKFHPDVNSPDDHDSLKRFHEITAAYEVLGDARARRDYDIRTFGGRGTGGTDENPSHIVDSRSGRKHVSKARGHTDLDHWMKRQTSVDFGKKQNILAQKGRGRAYSGHMGGGAANVHFTGSGRQQRNQSSGGGGSFMLLSLGFILLGFFVLR